MGQFCLAKPNAKIDDTVGPIFDLKFINPHPDQIPTFIGPNAEERAAQYEEDLFREAFVFIKIKVWDASMTQLKGLVYDRTYEDFHTTKYSNNITIFQRYRTSFKRFECELEDLKHGPGVPITYKGNPDLTLIGGDILTVEIFTPYLLDAKKSSVSLDMLVLDGHVGPEYIGIESMENRVKQDMGRNFTVGQSSSSDYAEVDGEHRMEENQNIPGELSILDKDLITLQYVRAKIHEIKRTTGKNPDRKTVLSLIKEYCSDEDIMYFLERYSCFDKK